MEFKIKKRGSATREFYTEEDYDASLKFSKIMLAQFGKFVKGIVLFGSSAREQGKGKSDIDILIIVDDVTILITPEIVDTYRIIVENAIVSVNPRLHITTLKLTSFWEYVRAGDPIAINILRDGYSIIDTGFFEPMQLLLKQGRIRPTQEAVWAYFVRSPATLHNSRWHILQATMDLYWAVIDSAHAALMKAGEIPPTPAHVATLLYDKFVRSKIIPKKYSDIMGSFYNMSRMILHREIKDVTPEEYSKYYRDAHDFVYAMKGIIEKQSFGEEKGKK